MKINLRVPLLIVLVIFVTNITFSQSKQNKTSNLTIVKYDANVNAPLTAKELSQINEVYGEKAQEDILSKPQRVKDIKNILRNRVVFKQTGEALKECPLLSEVPLFDYYKPNLTRDAVFNPETFNPLKYNFNFYSRGASMYKVDNTNYYIIIKSQHQ